MKKWSIVLAALFATSLFVHVVTAADDEEVDKPIPRVRGEGRAPRGEGGAERPRRGEGGEGRRRPQRGGQRPGMGGMMLMRAIDADNNGELSAREIENAVKALKKLDKNKDGKIGKDELRPPRPQRREGEGVEGGDRKRPQRRGGGEGGDRKRPPRRGGGEGGRKRPNVEGDN